MKNFNLFLALSFILFASTMQSQNVVLYVSTGNGPVNSSVKLFDENGTFIEDFIEPNAGGLDWPQDIIFLEDLGEVIVSGLNSGAVHRYNKNTGAYIDNFATIPLGPTRMKEGADGLIYVLQWNGTGKVLRYERDGTFVNEYTSIGIGGAIGMDWDVATNLYVSSYSNGTVSKFDSSGTFLSVFISGLMGPTNIWFDPTSGDGELLVANWNGNIVQRYNMDGVYIEDVIAPITQPEGVAILPNGNFLMGSGGGVDSILEFQSDGASVGVFASGNGLANPNAIYSRDASFLAVEENELSNIFVTPTIGNKFFLNTTITSKYQSIEIYDITGKLIDILNNEDTSWDASSHTEGLYLIISTKNNRKTTQKIIITKK